MTCQSISIVCGKNIALIESEGLLIRRFPGKVASLSVLLILERMAHC